MVMNRSLQGVNVQNMNVELVAQMFKNYQSNVLFHLEGELDVIDYCGSLLTILVQLQTTSKTQCSADEVVPEADHDRTTQHTPK